ncbi:hypothetical protein D1007_45088 [Hordeum vulgare]|nr:hypothetical protein D1007_45088 [Hordeum vulgare]
MGGGARKFAFIAEFLLSKAKLGDGSMRDIERYTIVKWEIDFAEIDPQDLQSMEEKAVKNVLEKIEEIIFWGPEQEVALLRFDNWKVEYVRIEDSEEMVDEIDQQDGWTTKQTMFHAELVDLKSDSKVGYVPSKVASLMANDDWASERQIMPMCTREVTVLPEVVDAEEGSDANEDKQEKDGESSIPTDTDTTRDRTVDVDGHLMEDDADDVDDAHDDELYGVVQNEQDLDVLLQDEQDFDVLVPTEDTDTYVGDIRADVVQAEPMLEVELPTEDIPSNVVPTEPILEVVLPTPDDIGSDDAATIVVRNKAAVPGSPLKKIKSLSELGVV